MAANRLLISFLITAFYACFVHTQTTPVILIPCSAVNDPNCLYKSDLVEGSLSSADSAMIYSIDLASTYGVNDFPKDSELQIEIRSLCGETPTDFPSVSIYVAKNIIPTRKSYAQTINASCDWEASCNSFGSLSVCNPKDHLWYATLYNNQPAGVSYGLKFSIVNTNSLVSNCPFETSETISFGPALLFLLTCIAIPTCLCICFCCGRSNRNNNKRCPRKESTTTTITSTTANKMSINSDSNSLVEQEQAPLLPPPYPQQAYPYPYPYHIQQQQQQQGQPVAPFYIMPVGQQQQQQQPFYVQYPVYPPQQQQQQ